jgi:hypothetical protein
MSSIKINDVLNKYDYTEVSIHNFNSSWIYLNDEIILSHLTNEKGKDALQNYYNRVLLKYYKENVDYKHINKDDELVTKYEQSVSMFPDKQKNKAKQTTKKYYAVTGETYKDILSRRTYNKKEVPIYSEKLISDKLSKLLNGKREVCINGNRNRIDILTDSEIIEVKNYNNRISSIGQILYYSSFYPDRILRIHLFDHNNERDKIFTDICDKLKIKVTYEENNLICTGLLHCEGDDEKKEAFDYTKASHNEKKEFVMKCLNV